MKQKESKLSLLNKKEKGTRNGIVIVDLAVIGGAVNMGKQAFVVAARKMVALQNGLLPKYGSISLFNNLFRLLGYQHAYHELFGKAPIFSPKRNHHPRI